MSMLFGPALVVPKTAAPDGAPVPPRNFVVAGALVQRSFKIVDYFQLLVWFIENPAAGLLKTRPFLEGLSLTDVDCC